MPEGCQLRATIGGWRHAEVEARGRAQVTGVTGADEWRSASVLVGALDDFSSHQ